MCRRIVGAATAVLALLLALVVTAQPARVPAPERNAETGLVFPNTIGPARKVGSTDYGKSNGTPEFGYAWNYETQAITTTFYVYNFGIAEISPGARGSVVLTQSPEAAREVDAVVQAFASTASPRQSY
jgi:hypothetical protein